MPTLEALYRQDPESLPFRQPVDPQLLGIPVSMWWYFSFPLKFVNSFIRIQFTYCTNHPFNGFCVLTELCIYHHSQFWMIFITPKKKPHFHKQSLPISTHSPYYQPTAGLPSASVDLSLLDISSKRVLQYVVLCDWVLSLSIMFSKFVHIVAQINTSFLLTAQQYFIIWLCIHSLYPFIS